MRFGQPIIGCLEDNVPMPQSRRGTGALRPQIQAMKVGQSFATTYSNAALHRMAKVLGMKLETRKEGRGKIRVWRVA